MFLFQRASNLVVNTGCESTDSDLPESRRLEFGLMKSAHIVMNIFESTREEIKQQIYHFHISNCPRYKDKGDLLQELASQ